MTAAAPRGPGPPGSTTPRRSRKTAARGDRCSATRSPAPAVAKRVAAVEFRLTTERRAA